MTIFMIYVNNIFVLNIPIICFCSTHHVPLLVVTTGRFGCCFLESLVVPTQKKKIEKQGGTNTVGCFSIPGIP